MILRGEDKFLARWEKFVELPCELPNLRVHKYDTEE
jgi:hypothetical protein